MDRRENMFQTRPQNSLFRVSETMHKHERRRHKSPVSALTPPLPTLHEQNLRRRNLVTSICSWLTLPVCQSVTTS